MRISDWSSDVCSSDLSQGIDGIPANNTSVFNVLQDHGMLQPTPENKAIWKATVTSESGWSNTFTFLRLSPALIWESGERPDLFSGTEIGRASCRESVCQYVSISVVAVCYKKQKQ